MTRDSLKMRFESRSQRFQPIISKTSQIALRATKFIVQRQVYKEKSRKNLKI